MAATVSDWVTIIDFYSRANGRSVVRIDVQRKDFLRELERLFASLAHGAVEELQLEPSEDLILSGRIKSVVLKRTAREESSGEIRTIKHSTGQIEVVWGGPATAWDKNMQLLQKVTDSEIPCHQYLTESGKDTDAELEIAFGERRPRGL